LPKRVSWWTIQIHQKNGFGRQGKRPARAMFVAFTLREKTGKQFVRPISARYMHLKEVEFYEKEMARIEKR
jgi:uncharacterized DUF497 family protein